MGFEANRHRNTLWAELRDPGFREVVTPRLVPWLYIGLSSGVAYAAAWLVWWTFQISLWLGLVHLLVVAPGAMIIGVMFVRALLECSIAVMEIRVHATELGELPRRVGSLPAVRRLAALSEARVWISRRETS